MLEAFRSRVRSLRWLLPALWWYLALRIVVVIALIFADVFTHERLLNKLTRWDSAWFLEAARSGWPRHLPMIDGHVASNTISFFPAFPLAIRYFAAVTFLPLSVSGLLLSAVSGLTATLAVGMLVRVYRSQDDALRAAVLFCVFPGTFVFNLIYAEGMIITFCALGLIALLRRRWLMAGLLGALATFTSPIALAFVVACAWAALTDLRQHRQVQALLAPLLAPLGFAFYMVWLWRHTGVLNAWRLTERDGWQSYPSLRYPFHILDVFFSNPWAAYKTIDLLIMGMLFTGVALYWAFRQRQPGPVLAYMLSAVVLITLSRPVGLRPRFLLVAFPLIIAVALRFEGRTGTVIRWVCVALWLTLSAFELYSWAIFP